MSKSERQPISIIIPTLNEAGNVGTLFARIHTSLTKAHIPYEIIVVDDHSTDGTAEIAMRASSTHNVRTLTKQGKPGKAYSLLEGFDAARHETLCMIDGDLQYPPEDIVAMYDKLDNNNADIVITQRTNNKTSALRKLSSTVFNLIFTKALFGITYDTQSGLKLFKKHVLRQINIAPSGWNFDLEFIVRSLENNFKIISHDIIFAERASGEAKIHLVSDAIEMATASVQLRRKTATKRVRSNFKNLQSLQRSALWLFTAASLTIGATLAIPNSASALSLEELASIPQTVFVADNTSTTEPEAAPQAAPTGTPIATAVATATATPTSTTAAQPSTTSATTSPRGSNATTTAVPTTATPRPTPTASRNSTAQASTNQTSNDNHYQTSVLGATKTKQLLSYATISVIAGTICLLIAALITPTKSLLQKLSRRDRQTIKA